MNESGVVIALLTDFGTRDPYVAAIRGVLMSKCHATVVDITHQIEPFDVFEAAMSLKFVHRDFPESTIFICVVDPGVGTDRSIIVAEDGGRIYLAPDNGLLSPVLSLQARVHRLAGSVVDSGRSSPTFHGRDFFAPAAAMLAEGFPLEEIGPELERGSLRKLEYDPPHIASDWADGTIIAIDRYGNAITDLQADAIRHLEPWSLTAGEHRVEIVVRTYGAAPEGQGVLLTGSRGTVEISFKKKSAADLLQLSRGQRVRLERRA